MLERAPVAIDTSVPSVARIYDYFLGGKDNFACDRELAGQLLRAAPEARSMARDNRAFLGRVVRYLTGQGIRQFVDLGTGLPTQHNVHEVAQEIDPDTRVAYVDNDPVVLVHARALLADNPHTTVIDADVRKPEQLLADPALRRLIDFAEPVAILLVGILYFFPEEDRPFDVVAALRDAIAPGSYLALSHIVSDDRPDEISQAQELYRSFLKRAGDARRTRAQVRSFFDGLDLVDPGLVYARQWRPDPGSAVDTGGTGGWMLGGVARKNPRA
jgi:O-methyltransferase involved in polyketide biosynthesis